MCGIVGYVGHQQAEGVVIEGLRRLEYRGYDSAGVALINDGKLASDKRAGKLANLEKAIADSPLPQVTTGIGHTRWATHGPPTDRNAHPHLGRERRVALVHNGIIENFAELRAELEADGETFASETDTEAAAKMLGRAFRATSDDQEAAELMGINNRHIYGLAMAIALAIVALAGISAGWSRAPSPPARRRSSRRSGTRRTA